MILVRKIVIKTKISNISSEPLTLKRKVCRKVSSLNYNESIYELLDNFIA